MHTLMWQEKRYTTGEQFEWVDRVIHSDNRWTLFCVWLTIQFDAETNGRLADLSAASCIVYGQYYNDPRYLNESPQCLGINPKGVTS